MSAAHRQPALAVVPRADLVFAPMMPTVPGGAALVPHLPIATERLTLRPFRRGDVEAVFDYRRRDDVCRYLFDEPMSYQTCVETIALRVGQLALQEEGDRIVLALEHSGAGVLVGEVSLLWRSVADQQGEIGYVLHPDHWGHGYATEASTALMNLGFDFGLHRIFARCDVRNLASVRVMERLGMRREAHFRGHQRTKGHWDEELIYAILRPDWRPSREYDDGGSADH